MEQKKLCRSMGDKAICGVCSGFARYFDIDPIIIRLVVVLLALTGTIGIWFYIIAAIVMPKDTDVYAQPAYRYDPQTGRPLYSDGTNVYENVARERSSQTESYAYTAGPAPEPAQEPAEAAEAAEAVDVEFKAEPYDSAEQTADATEEQTGDQTGSAAFGQEEAPNPGDASGEYRDNARNPYQNFQAYNTQQPKQAKKSGSKRNRNMGLLLIIVGVVILAKIILPRINMWIPISIALIFFGIFLLCRKD